MDLIADFAYPFPLRIIGSILGIPNEDHETIGSLATALNPVLEFLPMNAEVLAAVNSAVRELTAYFSALAAKRRSEPTNDLFSAMVHATEDGDTLTDDELVADAILLYVAGNETTAGGLGLMLLALHRNPEQLALLKAQPELRLNAVEELLRYDTPGQATARVLTTDVTLADTTLAAGSIVLGYIGAANRDPEVYREPDTLDLTRDFSQLPRPLTWGGRCAPLPGPHARAPRIRCCSRNTILTLSGHDPRHLGARVSSYSTDARACLPQRALVRLGVSLLSRYMTERGNLAPTQ